MPKHTITILGTTTLVLFAGYVALVATAIYFATLRTDLASEVGVLESEVAMLETHYYDAISRLGAADVYAQGFIIPREVSYIAPGGAEPVLTRANP